MAIKQVDVNRDFRTEQYVFDTAAEVSELPKISGQCGQGSTALCIEDGNVYVLNSLGEWKKI